MALNLDLIIFLRANARFRPPRLLAGTLGMTFPRQASTVVTYRYAVVSANSGRLCQWSTVLSFNPPASNAALMRAACTAAGPGTATRSLPRAFISHLLTSPALERHYPLVCSS
jgi:hypothetical protein